MQAAPTAVNMTAAGRHAPTNAPPAVVKPSVVQSVTGAGAPTPLAGTVTVKISALLVDHGEKSEATVNDLSEVREFLNF